VWQDQCSASSRLYSIYLGRRGARPEDAGRRIRPSGQRIDKFAQGQSGLAIANAPSFAYQLYKKIYQDTKALAPVRRGPVGAQTHRRLWARTGTKNKGLFATALLSREE